MSLCFYKLIFTKGISFNDKGTDDINIVVIFDEILFC